MESRYGIKKILWQIRCEKPQTWEDIIVIVPCDCSYKVPGSLVEVVNEHTPEWDIMMLSHFTDRLKPMLLKQKVLDAVEKAEGVDQMRGNVRASGGITTNMCCRRGEEESDLGLASPVPAGLNKEFTPEETFEPMSRLSEAMQMPWADRGVIYGDPLMAAQHKRFAANPTLCPTEYKNNVTAYTFARVQVFGLLQNFEEGEGQGNHAADLCPTEITRSSWGLEEFDRSITPSVIRDLHLSDDEDSLLDFSPTECPSGGDAILPRAVPTGRKTKGVPRQDKSGCGSIPEGPKVFSFDVDPDQYSINSDGDIPTHGPRGDAPLPPLALAGLKCFHEVSDVDSSSSACTASKLLWLDRDMDDPSFQTPPGKEMDKATTGVPPEVLVELPFDDSQSNLATLGDGDSMVPSRNQESKTVTFSVNVPKAASYFAKSLAAYMGEGSKLKSHFDNNNDEKRGDVMGTSMPVAHRSKIYRSSSLVYSRKSTSDFIAKRQGHSAAILKVSDYFNALPHDSLRSPTLDGYEEIVGNKGVFFTVEIASGSVVGCSLMTTAALNKPVSYCSAISSPLYRIITKHGLTRMQQLLCIRLASTVVQTHNHAAILGRVLDQGGFKDHNIFVEWNQMAKEMFGGTNIGEKCRCAPSQTRPWVGERLGNDIRVLGEIQYKVAKQEEAFRKNAKRPPNPTKLQGFIEKWAGQYCNRVSNIGNLTAMHGLQPALQLGIIPMGILLDYSPYSSVSAAYQGRTFSDKEKRELVLAVASYLNITTTMAEQILCETFRSTDPCDFFPANQLLFGSPTWVQQRGSVMRAKRLDTGEWFEVPRAAVAPCEQDLDAMVQSYIDEMSDIPTAHDDSAKKQAKGAYQSFCIPPAFGVAAYQEIRKQVMLFDPEETHARTMERCKDAIVEMLGIGGGDLSNTELVKRRIKQLEKEHPYPEKPGSKKGNKKAKKKAPKGVAKIKPKAPPPISLSRNLESAMTMVAHAGNPKDWGLLSALDGRRGVSKPRIAQSSGALQKQVAPRQTQVEAYQALTACLRRVGALEKTERSISSKDIQHRLVKAQSRTGRVSQGFCCGIPRLGWDPSSAADAGEAAKAIAFNVFGGFIVMELETLTPRICFQDKRSASQWLLFLGILVQGNKCPAFAAEVVEKQMTKAGVDKPWATPKAISAELRLQGRKTSLGYLIVENKTAWFAFPTKEANGEGVKSPKLWFYEFAKEEDSPPLFAKRERRKEETTHGQTNQAQDSIGQDPAVSTGFQSSSPCSPTTLQKRMAEEPTDLSGTERKKKKTRRSRRRAEKGLEMQLGAELMDALDGLI